jgi:hypothetical protein
MVLSKMLGIKNKIDGYFSEAIASLASMVVTAL